MDPNVYIPLGLAVLVVWLIYRRLRRNFGRQPVQERRLYARAVVLMLLSVLMVVSAAKDMRLMGALLAGIAPARCWATSACGIRSTRPPAGPATTRRTPISVSS